MILCRTHSFHFLVPLALPFGLQDASSQGGATRSATAFLDVPTRLAVAADRDTDGEVAAEEWAAFLAGFGADQAGLVDRRRLQARLLEVDLDRDGRMTGNDLDMLLRGEGRRSGRGGLASLVVPPLADADADGRLSDAERADFLASCASSPNAQIDERTRLDWVIRIEALPPPQDRNALNPPVLLATLGSMLDANSDGVIGIDDLAAHHAAIDANADGKIDREETALRLRTLDTGAIARAEQWTVPDEARARPPLMPWQRNLEDALAISAATGKPLLLCVNMDGESASESLAWLRYRDPAFVELARGFVPLLASPDRHDKRERDDRGRRLPDSRFGRLIDAEHIDVEPLLFERYFDGRRVAPRHVGVGPDGRILFDVFLVQDLSVVDEKLREFGVHRGRPTDPRESSTDGLLASPDAADREELERRFVESDERERAGLAALALSVERSTQHPELVRLALRDPIESVRRAGLDAMLADPAHAPLDQIPAAFARFGRDPELHARLVNAIRQAVDEAEDEQRRSDADFHARVCSTLHEPVQWIDIERWKLALELAESAWEEEPRGEDYDSTTERLDALEVASKRWPQDVEIAIGRAEGFLRLARIQIALGRNPTYFLHDTIAHCSRALALAPGDGRALGLHAWASHLLSESNTAADMARQALPHLLDRSGSMLALRVIEILAAESTRVLYEAISGGWGWPVAAIPDAIAAHELCVAHPASGEEHWKRYLELLGALRAHGEQADLVRRGLERMPLSGELHAWLRFQVLRDEGARALENTYSEGWHGNARGEQTAALDWFHGLATLAAAEQDVDNRDAETALDAYSRSIERFQRSIDAEPQFAGSAAHYQCFAFAGSARLLARAGRHEEALAALLRSVETAPASLELADGLSRTPLDSARELRDGFLRAGRDDLSRELEERMAANGVELDEQPVPGDEAGSESRSSGR